MKYSTSSGINGVQTERLKHRSKELINTLSEFLSSGWVKGNMTDEWKISSIARYVRKMI
jgi:hypothetical protein